MPDRGDIIDEKDLVSSISQNLWIVDFTSQLYDLHGHWVDDISDQDIEEIDNTLQNAIDEFHTSEGYDIDRINSLSNEELRDRARELDQAGSQAANYFDQIYQRTQGHQDLSSQIPDIIDESIRATFEDLFEENIEVSAGDTYVTTEIDDDTLNQIYSTVENSIEANIGDTVDQDTMDDIYDQLTEVKNEISAQGRQTRQRVGQEHDQTRGHVSEEHEQTRNYTTEEHDQTRGEMHSRFDDLEDQRGGDETSRRGLLAGIAAFLGAGYLIAEQAHDQDEFTNITWDDADNGNNNGGNTYPEGPYTTTWDDNSVSNWNSFVDRVPGEIDEVYTESATGQQYVVVENQDDQAFQVSYDELNLDKEEEANLETSDNYLEFFEMKE